MEITAKNLKSEAIKFTATKNGKEIGRAYLFLIFNGLREKPYGLLEDVFIEEEFRGKGIGTELIEAVVKKAKEMGCYKLIATSRHERPKVHALYEKLGFNDHGKEFRIDF